MSSSIKEFLKSIYPEANTDKDQWFDWPPDVFALTSIILERSGWYRIVVENKVFGPLAEKYEIDCWYTIPTWKFHVKEIQKEWETWLQHSDREKESTQNSTFRKHVDSFWDYLRCITLDDLNSGVADLNKMDIEEIEVHRDNHTGTEDEIKSELEEKRDCKLKKKLKFIVNLIELHTAADLICCNFGLVRVSAPSDGFREYKANVMLLLKGTLSNVSKAHASILPKLRVPKVGLSLRSMSQNLSYVRSEVDINWRTIPWMNVNENTINIMVIPEPANISADWFSPAADSIRNSFDSARYFSFKKPKNDSGSHQNYGKYVLDLIGKARKNNASVDIIVFPELALNYNEFKKIQEALYLNLDYSEIPIIISGLRSKPEEKRTDYTYETNGKTCTTNSVVLSCFFGGKWYDLFQDKHHRWRMDEAQVDNYQLSGILQGGGGWWENSTLTKRKLNFLSATGWLTICSLICEDLARVEPVSSVVRSVGPNLLVAVLLDGPQLKSRWPARYATVFAEDPGTSVLTVTARGMCKRSKPPTMDPKDDKSNVIALWKDDYGKFEELSIDEDASAILLNIESKAIQEYTAHGFGDNFAAGNLTLRNVSQIKLDHDYHEKKQPLNAVTQNRFKGFEDYKEILFSKTSAHMREMSAFVLIANSYLFSPDENIKRAFLRPVTVDSNKSKDVEDHSLLLNCRVDVSIISVLNILIKKLNQNNDDKNTELQDQDITDIYNILGKKTSVCALLFTCYLLIRIFEKFKQKRSVFFKLYDDITNTNTEPKEQTRREYRKAKLDYLNQLSKYCISNVKLSGNGDNYAGVCDEIKATCGQHFANNQLSPMMKIRFFQSVNLSILWSIHNHLSHTVIKENSSIEESKIKQKIEVAFKITKKPHEIHI